MLVIMASLDGSTSVETLLAAIHLERYLDTFCRAGLLLARDFTHLDHDALVSLGVTATGHRKRILRLVSHIQGLESQRANQKADLLCESRPSMMERAMLMKPIPKPRTVFNRRRTTPIHFSPTPEPAPPAPRRLSQESICFTMLEGLNSEATPTPGQTSEALSNPASSCDFPSEATPTPGDIRRPSQTSRTRPTRSLSLTDAGGVVPPVPPRFNHAAASSVSPPSSSVSPQSSSTRTELRRPISSLSSRPGSLDGTRLSGSPGSPSGGGIEMVSNDIYWGTSPGSAVPGGGRSYCIQAPPTPPRNAPDRNSGSTLSNNSSGSVREEPEEEISPYCESVFQTRRPPQTAEVRYNKLRPLGCRDRHLYDTGSTWTEAFSLTGF